MSEEEILYCFMNRNFEFVTYGDDLTDEISKAVGFDTIEKAKEYRNDFDEPKEWKIVKKKILFTLEEIVDE